MKALGCFFRAEKTFVNELSRHSAYQPICEGDVFFCSAEDDGYAHLHLVGGSSSPNVSFGELTEYFSETTAPADLRDFFMHGADDERAQLPAIPNSVVELTIIGFQNVTELPTQMPSLRELIVRGCGITSLQLPDGLEYLWLRDCQNLSSLSPFPSSLKTLRIENCPKLPA
jgi:hypothetical protein